MLTPDILCSTDQIIKGAYCPLHIFKVCICIFAVDLNTWDLVPSIILLDLALQRNHHFSDLRETFNSTLVLLVWIQQVTTHLHDKNRTIISTEPITRIDVEDAGCEICCDPGTREEHTEQGYLPTTDMYQCSVCNSTYHSSCLKQLQCYKEEDRINIDARSDWSCPACHDLSLDENEARSHASQHELLKVTWSPTWEPKKLMHSWASFRQML